MRIISPAAQTILEQGQGLEPVIIVQVWWNESAPVNYADRAFFEQGIIGRLLELSNVEDVVNISKASSSSAITVKLDDSIGDIKAVFDSVDIIMAQVYVLQWFTNLPLSDAFVIFEGEISSPIIWKEGERTITFDVLSKIQDQQYGFSADEGNFEYIPQELVGKAWPLTFGQVDMVKALKMWNLPQGLLQQSTKGQLNSNVQRVASLWASYYKAFNNWMQCNTKESYCQLQALNLKTEQDWSIFLGYAGLMPQPLVTAAVQTSTGSGALGIIYNQVAGVNPNKWNLKAANYAVQAENYLVQMQKIFQEIIALENAAAGQNNSLNVQGGNFPQGQNMSIQIGSVTYTGQFSGNIFTVLSSSNPYATDGVNLAGPLTISDSVAATQYAATVNEQNFFYNVAGAAAIASGEMVYIVSLFEVDVLGVYASYNGILTLVPSELYVVSYVNFGTIQATYITFPLALELLTSQIPGANGPVIQKSPWSNNIYCSIRSPVGPLTTDILIWLILQYTEFTYDVASFDACAGFLAQYPANFTLLSQGNIVQLLKEIAFQARCAIYFKEGVFYLQFLADMSTYVDTITEDDIEFGTMEVTCTPTEELVTKYTATYSASSSIIFPIVDPITGLIGPQATLLNPWTGETISPPGQDKVIWYFNLRAYGLIEKMDKYFIYSDPTLVERCSMFWLVRYTNTWKRIKFSTNLSHLKLETFDYVLLNFSRPWVANEPVVGMVESCQYDSGSERVQLTVWLPVRFGDMSPYPFAAPYSIEPTLVFPEEFEAQSLGTQNKSVGGGRALIPPGNLGTAGGYTPVSVTPGITPSDTGFSAAVGATSMDATGFQSSANTTPSGQSNQYIIKDVVDPGNADFPAVFPGKVKSQFSGNQYFVSVWFNGMKNPSNDVLVTQIQINENDIIDEGTACFVCRSIIMQPAAYGQPLGISNYTTEYTMQVPVYQASNTPSPDVPNPDGGSPTPPGAGDFGGTTGSGASTETGSPDSSPPVDNSEGTPDESL